MSCSIWNLCADRSAAPASSYQRLEEEKENGLEEEEEILSRELSFQCSCSEGVQKLSSAEAFIQFFFYVDKAFDTSLSRSPLHRPECKLCKREIILLNADGSLPLAQKKREKLKELARETRIFYTALSFFDPRCFSPRLFQPNQAFWNYLAFETHRAYKEEMKRVGKKEESGKVRCIDWGADGEGLRFRVTVNPWGSYAFTMSARGDRYFQGKVEENERFRYTRCLPLQPSDGNGRAPL